jgi:hypothetical protein
MTGFPEKLGNSPLNKNKSLAKQGIFWKPEREKCRTGVLESLRKHTDQTPADGPNSKIFRPDSKIQIFII